MLKVAITGNIASGKSEVEKILKEKSYNVLDTDTVAHDLLEIESVKNKICETFSDFDILEDNKISRMKLGKIVFADRNLRKKLESILHPLVKEELGRFFRFNKEEKIAFASVPLLFETGFENLFDKIILIYADDELRLNRLVKRNDLPLEYAKNRLKIQMEQAEKVNLSDYIIYNNSNLENLSKEVEKVLDYLLKNSTSPDVK